MPRTLFSTDHANLLHALDNAEGDDDILQAAGRLRAYRLACLTTEDGRTNYSAYRATPAEAIGVLSDTLNAGCTNQTHEFGTAIDADHRTLQQRLYGLFFQLIRRFAETEGGGLDGRNQAAYDTCKQIVDLCDKNDVRLGRLPNI